jgi:hypothetical protein
MLLHLKFCVEWFNQIQIGFENLLKNGFEKLEKKKERNFFLLSGRFPPAAQLPGLPQRPASSSRVRSRMGRAQAAAAGPTRASARVPHPVAARFPSPSRRHVGPACQRLLPLSFFFLRRFPPAERRLLFSPIRIDLQIFLLSITGDAYGL